MKNKKPQFPRKKEIALVKQKTSCLLTSLSLFCLLLLNAVVFEPGLKAQQTISSAGGELSGSTGKVSYTVGQIFFHNYEGETGSVAEGIQQPYEIYVLTQTDELPQIDLVAFAYPNPVSGKLNLKVESISSQNLVYQLYNINGGLLETERISSNNTEIDMEGRVPAVYFLKILDNEKEIKTFKIVKH